MRRYDIINVCDYLIETYELVSSRKNFYIVYFLK